MPTLLYGMLTWTTLRRLPLLHSRVADFLRRALPKIAERHDCRIVEIGSVKNHVHLMLELSVLSVFAAPGHGVAGAGARVGNRDGYMPRARLRWASGYDFRTLGVRDLDRAMAYVRNQSTRHPELAIEELPGGEPGLGACGVVSRAKSPGSAHVRP